MSSTFDPRAPSVKNPSGPRPPIGSARVGQMTGSPARVTTVPCVGAIVRDGDDRLLLVRRGTEPDRGRWTLPGGKVEPGESGPVAVAREVREETGLDVEVVGDPVGSVELRLDDTHVAAVVDYACRPRPGSGPPRAGDDAADAGWFTPTELAGLDCTPGLLPTLASWGIIPPELGQNPSGRPTRPTGFSR